LQIRVVNEAAFAPNLASTINQGAFNFGNATGAWIGGVALTHGVAYERLAWIGVALAAAALALSLYSYWLDGKTGLARPASQRTMTESAN
jgi:DHA1 family inner membrane transport protein